MKTITRDLVRIALVATFTVGSGLAQQTAAAKHVKDIRAEQPQKVIAASSLCQRVRSDGHAYIHRREVNAGMLEADLFTLMQNSDEVILASNFTDQIDSLAPSGEDAVEYYDAKVLRAFKGSHKVGDLVTFTLPRGGVYCGLKSIQGGAGNSGAVTLSGGPDWGKVPFIGPYVLFLRQSRGEETQLTPALRLAAGDGLQGMFALRGHYDRSSYTDCLSGLPSGTAKCTSALEASQEKVKIPYELDPLKPKYETMPVSSFLNEVQSVADSVGSAGQPSTAK